MYRCLNAGKCSTRLNGNFSCDCLSPFFGPQCEIGSFSLLFIFFLFPIKMVNKNREFGDRRTNNFAEFL